MSNLIKALSYNPITQAIHAMLAGGKQLPVDVKYPTAAAAYLSTSQSAKTSGSSYKVPFNIEDFDVGSYYDSVTNFRYQPLVAGRYMLNINICMLPDTGNSLTDSAAIIYKNGSAYRMLGFGDGNGATMNRHTACGSILVDMNGSTDYVEVYAYCVTTTGTWSIEGGSFTGSARNTWFDAVKID